jgi:precorrin-2 dehydrogenase/sirohydrochlorin ferrochelatase
MSEWYPMLLKIEGRKCVVVGGGKVAEHKTKGLLQAKADIVMFSPLVTSVIQGWVDAGSIQLINREVQEDDLTDAELIFTATDRHEVNKWVADIADKRGIPVNVADEGERGSFLVPAVVRRGDLILTASASGAGPALAATIIQELSDQYGPEYEEYIDALRTIRTVVKREVKDVLERRELLQAAVTPDALEEWRGAAWLHDTVKLLDRLRQRAQDRKGK